MIRLYALGKKIDGELKLLSSCGAQSNEQTFTADTRNAIVGTEAQFDVRDHAAYFKARRGLSLYEIRVVKTSRRRK